MTPDEIRAGVDAVGGTARQPREEDGMSRRTRPRRSVLHAPPSEQCGFDWTSRKGVPVACVDFEGHDGPHSGVAEAAS